MAEVIRQGLRSHLGKRPAKAPPGAGAFDSGHTDTADRAEELLAKSIRVRGRRSVRDLKARIRFAQTDTTTEPSPREPGMMENRGRAMTARFRTMNAMLEQLRLSRTVRKAELERGDCVLVTTEHSVYSIQVLEDATYCIRGGWFDRQKLSPVTESVAGCNWGGSAIKNDIVAACGLHLEFGNRVVTSRIREVLVIRGGARESRGLRPIHSPELLVSCYGPRCETASSG